MAKRKIHSISFKSKVALEAIRGDQTVAELAAKYQVHPTMVTKWKKQAVEGMSDTFFRGGRREHREASYEARIKELHAKIGELRRWRGTFWPRPSVAESRPEDGHDRHQSQ